MSIDDSGESSSCAVRSKYFYRICAMDESLSEFQEAKKSNTGPKNTAKKVNKPRKPPKRPRGQKDIRSALRSKKNELELYSKDFDKVCKKAGIDVDSEQLQLAIALSKSLQHTASPSSQSIVGSQTVTTQDRIGKIRTTLQEYGFKVPEVKIDGNTRKIRKPRKNYKLIQTGDVAKKEIIANRYSKVLFQNITHCSVYCSDVDAADIPLYYLATNVVYDLLRITDTFYVDNLIEKSTSTGNLLRDWSKIPGRPESPKLFDPMSMNFSEMECSQDELDIILSGSLKSCKVIVGDKLKDWLNNKQNKSVTEDNISIENMHDEKICESNQEYTLRVNQDIEHFVEPISTLNKCRSLSPDMFDDEVSDIFDESKNLTTRNDNSPEVHKTNIDLQLMDLTKPIGEKSQSELCPTGNGTNRKSNDMELTESIHIQDNGQHAIDPLSSQASQKSNVTKRKSNDFMELTTCATTSSQPVRNNIDLTQSLDIIEEKPLEVETEKKEVKKSMNSNESNEIDLTKSPENNNDDSQNRNTPEEVDPGINAECMDLTQSSNTSDELPFVSLTATKAHSSGDIIILDINDYAHINKRTNSQTEEEVHIDLTQNMHANNDVSQTFFEEYNHDHSDSIEPKENNLGAKANEENHDRIDLTESTERVCNKNDSPWKTSECLKEHSSNSFSQPKYRKQDCSQIIIEAVPVKVNPSNSLIKHHRKVKHTVSPCDDNTIDDIDLTQKSDTSEDLSQTPKNDCFNSSKVQDMEANKEDPVKENDLPAVRNSQRCSSLGKKDEVSLDYDELINNDANEELVYLKGANLESTVSEIADENLQIFSKSNSFLSNCSQNSEVFEISDRELDYSLHKSKLEMPLDNFAFGGISIMDDISNIGTSKKSIEADKKSVVNDVENDCIPGTDINNTAVSNKRNEISPIKHRRITEIATPQKACCSNNVTVTTPRNSEMIIITNNVTPMGDYASMSTPDIHKELDKYGIKPFKRKRAIQLLTHIYNQTHPIIDAANELASPPKRHKPNDFPLTSLNELILPRKLLTSPRKDSENSDKNIDIYKEKENLSQCEERKKTKGKGKGKSSLNREKKDAPEKSNGIKDNTQERSKEIVISEVPILKEIECSPDDWVFQKREKAKVSSCRVPLHIAFYNYVSSRRDLREAILCYDPIEIDLIHKDLVGHGHRYDPKDLLKFLDKKCITVKTTDDARNHRKP